MFTNRILTDQDEVKTVQGNQKNQPVKERDQSTECFVDAFIRNTAQMLKQSDEPSRVAKLIREMIDELIKQCKSDEDAICLMIFKGSILLELTKKREDEKKNDTIRVAA